MNIIIHTKHMLILLRLFLKKNNDRNKYVEEYADNDDHF